MEEWKDRSSRFDKSVKKTEEKLKEQISIGREVTIRVMNYFKRRERSFRSLTASNGINLDWSG